MDAGSFRSKYSEDGPIMLTNFITGWALLSIVVTAFWCCIFHNGLSEDL